MFEKVKLFFETEDAALLSEEQKIIRKELQIASCVLLLETAFVDTSFPQAEQDAILEILIKHFRLNEQEAQDVMDLASIARQRRGKVSIFVQVINRLFDAAQKELLYATIWKVVQADHVIDQRELLLVGKFAEWLKLSSEQQKEARQLVIDGKV